MRTRTKTSYMTLPAGKEVLTYPNGSVYLTQLGTSRDILESEFAITDEVGFAQTSHYCVNSKRWFTLIPVTDAPVLYSTTGFKHTASGGYRQLQVMDSSGAQYSHGVTVDVDDDDPQWGKLSAEAMEFMRPSFNDGSMDLVNSIRELKDMVRLKDLLRFGPPKWKSGELKPESRAQRRGRLLRYGANAHLSWAFGVAPFLRDLKGILDAIQRVRNGLSVFQANQGKVMTKHFAKSWSFPNDQEVVTFPGLYNWSVRCEHTMRYSPRYVCTLKYKYLVPNLPPFVNTLSAYLDAFGVGADPSIIWNAIPYSFIVDWFVDIGGWLHSMREDTLGQYIQILDLCHSVKFIRSTSTTVNTGAGNTPCFGEVYSYYKRMPIERLSFSSPPGRSPGWGQAILGLSLIITHSKPNPTIGARKVPRIQSRLHRRHWGPGYAR